MQIRAIAQAKINWSLNILSTREDGYHEMDMLMQRIELHDELIFRPADELRLMINGRLVAMPRKNLVLKAAAALCERAGRELGANISMTKRIPVRAGLGGGSADCAVALMALNRMWGLGYDARELMDIGFSLGADVPFCMEGVFARVGGIGERLEKLSRPQRIPIVLVMPEEGLSTAGVFGEYDAGEKAPLNIDTAALAQALVRRDLAACREYAGNSLEAPAMRLMPEIKGIIDDLYANGADFAHMTGSGSCVFGAFSSDEAARRAIVSMGRGIFTHTVGREV